MKGIKLLAYIIFLIFIIIIFFNRSIMMDSSLLYSKNDEEEIEYYYYDNYIKNIENINRPLIFIHVPNERNERNWDSFYSRSNKKLNLDLCKLCIKSVIQNCNNNYYTVVIFNNSNIKDILNEKDEEDLCNVSDPEMLSGVDLKQWEQYCRTKILYKYGGIVMSPYFYFIDTINENLFSSELTIMKTNNEGLNVSNELYIPTLSYFMSATKGNDDVLLYCKYLEHLCINHYSVDHKHFDKTFEKLKCLPSLDPGFIGSKDITNNPIFTQDLISNKKIQLCNNCVCVYINIDYLKKNSYNSWILKMNEEQLKKMNNFLGLLLRR